MRRISQQKETTLSHVILMASAVLVVLLTLALAREIRMRRALQSLLKKLLSFWRSRDEEEPVARRGRADDDAADGGRVR
jgi:hypothetical protein